MKKTVIVIIVVIVIALIGFSIYFLSKNGNKEISVFPISQKNKGDLIVVVSPVKDSLVSSPLSVAGRVRGNWFFEGSFPIILTDLDGKILAEGHASAQGDWMTNDFVKFIGTLQFDKPTDTTKGILIFRKNNPSGDIQNDDSYEVSISFK